MKTDEIIHLHDPILAALDAGTLQRYPWDRAEDERLKKLADEQRAWLNRPRAEVRRAKGKPQETMFKETE